MTVTAATAGAPPAAQVCCALLRDRIASGDLPGGTWLREATVASSMGASRTPVREALRLLAAEGLVELVPNRGARVNTWSSDDIDETYQLRALLEGHGAALAARRVTAEQIDAIVAAEDAYEAALGARPTPETAANCNNVFHAQVTAAAASPRLTTLLALVQSTPLVTRALGLYGENDARRSMVQHRDIIVAIRHGDSELAAVAMRSHILAARYTAAAADSAGAAVTDGSGLRR